MNAQVEAWRANWITERVSRTACHVSGVGVRVERSDTDPSKDKITLDNTEGVDLKKWDVGQLTQEAITMWMDGEF